MLRPVVAGSTVDIAIRISVQVIRGAPRLLQVLCALLFQGAVICATTRGALAENRIGRSSTYATDVAKMLQSPVFHVNGEDPEAVAQAVTLATEYRQRYHGDVVLDLFCYRKYGHNEGDEPAYTQPVMYQKIRKHPTVRTLWAERLVAEGLPGDVDEDTGREVPPPALRAPVRLDVTDDAVELLVQFAATDVVTANGETVRASETENPDLFWGLRGGGGNFGVVTSFEFQAHPVGPEVLAGLIVHPFEDAGDVLRAYRDFCAQAPDEVTALNESARAAWANAGRAGSPRPNLR